MLPLLRHCWGAATGVSQYHNLLLDIKLSQVDNAQPLNALASVKVMRFHRAVRRTARNFLCCEHDVSDLSDLILHFVWGNTIKQMWCLVFFFFNSVFQSHMLFFPFSEGLPLSDTGLVLVFPGLMTTIRKRLFIEVCRSVEPLNISVLFARMYGNIFAKLSVMCRHYTGSSLVLCVFLCLDDS